VQKYEKGTNRIGASRLQQISHIVQVPVAFFFEGAPIASAPHGSNGSALSMAQIDEFVSDSNGLRLIEAFMRINNAALRRRIVMLVQEIAGAKGAPGSATMLLLVAACYRGPPKSNRTAALAPQAATKPPRRRAA
jgi:transcriptional regulator with XRE-family HTH domain